MSSLRTPKEKGFLEQAPAGKTGALDLSGDRLRLQTEIQQLAAEKMKTASPEAKKVLGLLDKIRVNTAVGSQFDIDVYAPQKEVGGMSQPVSVATGRLCFVNFVEGKKPPAEDEQLLQRKLYLVRELK